MYQARQASDPSGLDGTRYNCTQTNFDTALPYPKLDMWSKFPDFQTRIRDAIVKRQALDRIMIGFNGTYRAKTSDHTVNMLLQDINISYRASVTARLSPRC
ncbi:P2 family phage major capsid protein [Yersinia enterocolitica]|nr:P2 family phage major capsid protein [Yersinia enterocolitica]